jgi:hypothetical protein
MDFARPTSSRPVAHYPGAAQVEAEGAAAALAIPGLGLRSSLVRLNACTTRQVIRAVREEVDARAAAGRVRGDVRAPGRRREPASRAPPRLIGHHGDGDVGGVETSDRLGRSVDELDSVD